VAAGLFSRAGLAAFLEPIQDLIGPEPLEPMQRFVQRCELLVRNAANLLDGLDVLLVERIHDAADLLALRGQANPDASDTMA